MRRLKREAGRVSRCIQVPFVDNVHANPARICAASIPSKQRDPPAWIAEGHKDFSIPGSRCESFPLAWIQHSCRIDFLHEATARFQSEGNDLVHIKVFEAAESAAEGDGEVGFFGEFPIASIAGLVLISVDGVVFDHSRFPVFGEFAGDEGLIRLQGQVEVLVFVDPVKGDGCLRVIYDGVALEVAGWQEFVFKSEATVFQLAVLVFEEGVDRAGVDDVVITPDPFIPVGEEIDAGFDSNSGEKFLKDRRVASDRDALIAVAEVVVVVGQADREAFEDTGRKFARGASPLFGRISFDKDFVDLPSDLGEAPLLHVGGVLDRFPDLGKLRLGFGWGTDTPDLLKGHQIDREGIEGSGVIYLYPVDVVVEFRKSVDVVPNPAIRGVENVGPVDLLVAVRFFNVPGEAVAPDVVPFLDHVNLVARIGQFPRANRSVDPGSDNQDLHPTINRARPVGRRGFSRGFRPRGVVPRCSGR